MRQNLSRLIVLLLAGWTVLAKAQPAGPGGPLDGPLPAPGAAGDSYVTRPPPSGPPVTVFVLPPRPRLIPLADPPRDDMRGATLMIGGGIESFTTPLSSRLYAGPAWGAILVFKPLRILGLELGYTGAYNLFRPDRLPGYDPSVGAYVVRQGVHAAVSVGLLPTRFQPYLLAGLSLNYLTVRGAQADGYASGFDGSVPLGGGIRTYFWGGFTLDLRGTYDFTFGSPFALRVNEIEGSTTPRITDQGRWRVALYFGVTF